MIFLRLLGAMIVTDYLLMETILRRTPPDSRFNPHTPHVGSDLFWFGRSCKRCVSIHAPHVGSDTDYKCPHCIMIVSIHAPHVGSDALGDEFQRLFKVSIHAPHVGSDP